MLSSKCSAHVNTRQGFPGSLGLTEAEKDLETTSPDPGNPLWNLESQ